MADDRPINIITPSAFLLFDDLNRTKWPQKISDSRSAYVALKAHFLKYIEHPDDLQSTVDPLTDDEQSPWQILRNDEQMRADISQDVDRCLQENFFFREPETKAKMINILFIYSKLNPDLGYRQGMHELLAPILWVINRDAIDPECLKEFHPDEQDEEAMVQLLDSDFIEHDAFTLFCSVMQNTRAYYEHNRHRSANGQMDAIPIVLQCQHIHDELLVAIDLELADHLQVLEILPQIFLTRWMRLLFGREFPFQDVLIIWDLLFAEGLRPELIDYICIAMLLRIRWQLLNADSSEALSLLLRYPSPHPQAPLSFLQDGLYLEQNPTPERGAFVIAKYSGKPPDSSKWLDPLNGKFRPSSKILSRTNLRGGSETNSPSRSPARSSPLSIEALLQDVSEGIQRRTESWSVAKAVRGAVSEARKNMQTIQAEHSPRPTKFGQSSVLPTVEASLPQESDTVAELTAKIESLEVKNKALAKKLSQALNDIRSCMMKNENIDSNVAATVKSALTDIQSVQTCLESPPPSRSAQQVSNDGDNTKERNGVANSVSKPEKPKPSENKSPERPSQDGSESSKPSPKPPIENESEKRATASRSQVHPSMPLRHVTRPSLADSEFSWMIGGNRHLSSFVSQASVPPEQTRHGDVRTKQSALFGNHEDDQTRPNADSDGMALRSLRGAKGRE